VLLQFLVNGLVTGLVYALVALGFNVIYSTTRVFHFAHGAVYAVSAYAFYALTVLLKVHWLPAAAAALALGAILGMVIEVLVYYPLHVRNSPSAVSTISSLGVYIALANVLAMLFGSETRVLSAAVQQPLHLGPVLLAQAQVLQLVVSTGLLVLVALFIRFSSMGLALRGMTDNPKLAGALGFPVRGLRLAGFAGASLLCAAAAILMALDVGITPHMGLSVVLVGAVAAILGGIGNFAAAIPGGLALGLLQSLVAWRISTRWEAAVSFVLLLALLVFRPQGIFGRRRRTEEQ
jgi:branched-chain amino acid transport system permease protein